jgi:flagellar protein FlbD
MILVTKLNGAPFAVNADLIERITADPDTTLTLVDGVRYIVRESVSDVVQRVTEYRAAILDLAMRARSGAISSPEGRN